MRRGVRPGTATAHPTEPPGCDAAVSAAPALSPSPPVGLFDKLKAMFQSGGKAGKSNLPIVDVAKRFDLVGRTGQGSMSKVWRAYDRKLGRTICLKVLDKLKTDKFEARFPGLKRPSEGEICMGLRHQHVVKTFEYGLTKDKEMFLVMELIEGVGLNFLIETKHKDLEGRRIDYLCQFAEGLEYVHRQGFIHRDICPRNCMVDKEGVVKIIDFGLTIPNKPEFCRPGNRTGTTDYLAPELIARKTTDTRVDMFALGVTAYEMFTGTLPWEKGSSQETLLKHLNVPGRDPLDADPNLDPETAAFLRKAVERDPAERFQNPSEFKAALLELPGR